MTPTILKKNFFKMLIYIFILWLLIVLWGFIFAWRRVPEYIPNENVELPVSIMSSDEYGEVINTHPRPYIVHLENDNGGGVLIYGAEHTKNPNDPQIADIQKQWINFKPSIALVESRLGIMFPGLMNPVETFSEPGAVHALARQSGIPTYTWEPPIEVEMANLLRQPFSQEQIALRVILNPAFSARRFGKADDSEKIVQDSLQDKINYPGLENTFSNIEEIDIAWAKYFPNGPDWRDVSDEYGLPGFLSEIDTNLARDEHFVQVIIELVGQGERVFAVAGVSHAVKIEAALQGYFETNP